MIPVPIIAILPVNFHSNQRRKEADPTYNDPQIQWRISRSTQNRLKIQIQSRSMSDPPLSDIDFKNKMAWIWTTPNDAT